MVPKTCKKSFDSCVFFPKKMRFCKECNINQICNEFNILNDENKQFEAIFKWLKRQTSKEFGHKLLYNKDDC